MTQGATANDKRQVLQICRQTHHHWPHDLSLTPKIPTAAFDMRITKEDFPSCWGKSFLIIIGYINNAH